MTLKWHDVSRALYPGMTVWPGDPTLRLDPASRIANGDSCNTSVVSMPTHAGTHCDAPWHFVEEDAKLDQVDPAVFFGTATLLACTGVDVIRADDLGPDPLPPRILLKTDNAGFDPDGPFREDFVAVAEDAARRMVDEGVRLVGIDYLSIAPYGQSGPTHHVLLGAGVFVVEGLVLADFAPGDYEFVVLPLPLAGADGAPCRAFIGTRGGH